MNIIGWPVCLSNDKGYLIVAAAEIEGGHVLPLDSNSLLEQLQRIIKDFKFWCGDYEIINNFTPQVFLPSCQLFQWKG